MELEKEVCDAIQWFWNTRARQEKQQGSRSGQKDPGNRAGVTGGKQLDRFIDLCRRVLMREGIPHDYIITGNKLELPGFFRPTKKWDLIVRSKDSVHIALEMKALCGPSFGNNCNNRTEEALGNAIDVLTAHKNGAFRSARPIWLGYLLLLEDAAKSTSPVKSAEPHFPVLEEFQGASYERRCELLCERLVSERLYDAACFLLSNRQDGLKGIYREPNKDLGFHAFAAHLAGRAVTFSRMPR